MARKKKVKEPLKLWELPLEEVQKLYDHVSKFPDSKMAVIYKAELGRKDRSKPMDIDLLFNHEDHE